MQEQDEVRIQSAVKPAFMQGSSNRVTEIIPIYFYL